MEMHAADATCRTWAIRLVLLLVILTSLTGAVSGQRVCCQGDVWLKWNNDRRESYVWGYMIGYSHAYWEGCRQAMKSLPAGTRSESVESGCQSRQPDFSKGTTFWTQQVTEFYKTYADDRDVNIDEILEQLGSGLTLEQIHKYPFMRRRSEGSDVERKNR